MTDEDKTKEQLMDDLAELRRRIAESERQESDVKLMAKSLAEKHNLLRALIDNVPDQIYVKDAKGRFAMVNKSLARLVGAKAPEELVGKTDFDFFPHEASAEYYAYEQEIMRTGQPVVNKEEPSIDQTGNKEWVLTTKVPLRDNDGKIIGLMGINRDITELKRTEEALRKSEQGKKAILDGISELVIYQNTEMRILWANRSAVESSALPPEYLVGRYCYELWHHRSEPCAGCPVKKALETGEPQRAEIITKDGVVLLMRGYPLQDENGSLTGVVEVALDVTERKRAEEALRRSKERFQEVVENAQEWVWEVDPNGLYTYASPVVERILGYEPEEIVGSKHFYDMFHPEDREKIKKAAFDVFAQRQPFREFINRNVHKDGRTVWLSTSGVPMLDDRGNLVGYRGADADITQRKQAEEALANEKERLAVTLRSIADGVIATDLEGKVVLINEVAERFTGWTEKEALGRSLEQVFHIVNEDTREPCRDPVKKVMESGGMVDLADDLASDVVLLTRDGRERVIADSGGPIRDKDSRIIGVILVFRDITEEREIEGELVKAQKLESIGVLAGGIAHDFNNILTGILGNISLARMYKDPHKISERLVEAEKASIRARDLTQRLLTFSKGGAPIMKTASIAELLRESASFASSGSNVRCAFSIADELWPVEIDEGQMNQVINNLMVNAEEAMPEGGIVKVRAENVDVGSENVLPIKSGKYVRVSIEDHGIGIPKEHIQKIFDPYFTTKQKGSGLGLATSYSIVRNHGGYITAESQVGAGTTFYVYIPASPEAILAMERKEVEEPDTGGGRILVMDDEDVVRELAGNMLNTIGYEAVLARGGTEAIELYEKAKGSDRPFDLVIMDLTIPGGMGGKEAVQKLIKIDPEAKVIASSGYSSDPVMSDFRKYGFRAAIAKPYRISELRNTLNQAMSDVEQVSSSDYT